MWKTKKYTWKYTTPCLRYRIKTRTDFHCVLTVHMFIPLVLHRRSLVRSVVYLPLLASKNYHRLRSKSTQNTIPQ